MRISITLVKIQLIPKVILHSFFCNQNLLWLQGYSSKPLEILKWFKWYNACWTYFKQIVHQFLEVLTPSPEKLCFPLRLSLTSLNSSLHTHFSKWGLLLKYPAGRWLWCASHHVWCWDPCRLLEVPFRGSNPCTKPASLLLELHVSGFPHTAMDTACEEPGMASRASTTRKTHLLWN